MRRRCSKSIKIQRFFGFTFSKFTICVDNIEVLRVVFANQICVVKPNRHNKQVASFIFAIGTSISVGAC